MKPETAAIHAGQQIDPSTGAVTQPIYMSTTYERATDGEYPLGYIYGRDNNPNRKLIETRIARLEHGAEAVAFASGSVVMMTIFQALSSGDHVIMPDDIYFGIRAIMNEFFVPWGLQVDFVDMTDLDSVRMALRHNTRLIVLETPSNPQLKVTDISAIVAIAKDSGAMVLCDNTLPTPILQTPLDLGCDLVVHATTKYIGGHSDVLGGIVVSKEDNDFYQRIRRIQQLGGAIPSPFDCWLLQRGLQTLPVRMRMIDENAHKVAEFLESHAQVEQVLYPMLESHNDYAVAKKQMRGGGGLLSFLFKGDEAQTMQVVAKVKLFTRATSFGGTHSLIEHRASIESPDSKTPRNLIRMSIGLEHVDDLIADLEQALQD